MEDEPSSICDDDTFAANAEDLDTTDDQTATGSSFATPNMAERECRNGSRVERACNNASQSRNQSQQNRQGTPEPARNRHRERRDGMSTGYQMATRNRTAAGTSTGSKATVVKHSVETSTSEELSGACAEVVLNNSAAQDNELVTDETVESMCEPNAPVLATPFALDMSSLSSEAIHSALSNHNWQADKSTVMERLSFMFNNELMADVHFLVGRGEQRQRIPAHKFVLSVSSAVFDAMFNGGMAINDDNVELPDVEPAAFLSMLRFIYTDEVVIEPDTVMHCLYTAKKYAVVALERACVDFLKKNLSSDNAFMLLTQARLFDEPQLAAMCLEMIDKMTSEALTADSFTEIDVDTLCTVLERDTLGIREYKLFSAVCRWAQAECTRQQLPSTVENQRSILSSSRALQLIRFPLMTVEEFAAGPAQSGLLTDRQIVDLFLYFTVSSPAKRTVPFSDVPRCCLTGREQVISRFCKIETRWGYSGTSDRIRFTVNRKIFVIGFGLYGSIHSPAEYFVNIQIIHTDTGQTCGSNDVSFMSDGSKSTFRTMFKEPVEIQANTSYTASATLKGPDSFYGTKGLRKVTHESVSSGKVTFVFSYAAGNNNGTSVEDGQLPEIIFYT